MKLWAITEDFRVQEVEVEARPQHGEGCFWVPALGQTLTIGYHLFHQKDMAVSVLRENINQQMHRLRSALETIDSSELQLEQAQRANGPPRRSGDEDFHRQTAAIIFDCSEEEVTEEMRLRAKRINLGLILREHL